MYKITAQQLSAALTCPIARAQKWVDAINQAMEKYEINTPIRIAHFLAQIGHESASLFYVREIASGKDYDNRVKLGNTKPEAIAIAKANGTSTGVFYKGRGLIQVTGYDNYLECSKDLGVDFVNFPTKLELPEYAALSAAWFWGEHKLNELADMDHLMDITRIINGRLMLGLEQRRNILKQAKVVLGI